MPGADALRVEFDRRCSTERRHDPLQITDATGKVMATRSGREWSDWSAELRIPGIFILIGFFFSNLSGLYANILYVCHACFLL